MLGGAVVEIFSTICFCIFCVPVLYDFYVFISLFIFKMKPIIWHRNVLCVFLIICILFIDSAFPIKCYQCSSDTDKNNDVCGAYSKFDVIRNVPVECYSEEANTPGIFCVKIVKQGPRGFIWDGRWRTVIRRCASVSETGVIGYCNWGHDETGVYWEECYCGTDGCNGASTISLFTFLPLIVFVIHFLFQ